MKGHKLKKHGDETEAKNKWRTMQNSFRSLARC